MNEHSGVSHPHPPGWFDLVSVMIKGMVANGRPAAGGSVPL